jgi:hypothetical protein
VPPAIDEDAQRHVQPRLRNPFHSLALIGDHFTQVDAAVKQGKVVLHQVPQHQQLLVPSFESGNDALVQWLND